MIKIEVWPGGDESRATEMHRGYIWNDGTGTTEHGNYCARFNRKGDKGKRIEAWRTAKIDHFARKKLLAWDLLAQCLVMAMGPERVRYWGKTRGAKDE